MKKIFLVLCLFLVSLISIAQQDEFQFQKRANHVYNHEEKTPFFIPYPDTISLLNITINAPNLNGWSILGKSCAGCASYYYKILRSVKPVRAEDSLYYYYFYFYYYSNSFLYTKEKTGTYLSDINFLLEEKLVFNVPYILIEQGKVIYGAWMRSQNPLANVTFKPTKVSVH